jgi:hypothetical protein
MTTRKNVILIWDNISGGEINPENKILKKKIFCLKDFIEKRFIYFLFIPKTAKNITKDIMKFK